MSILWAVFADCDFVFVDDVKKLFDQADDRYAVMVVKHDYTPKEGIKMDGCKQLPYPRKNWSSMILWNCGHASNQQVTPDLVNSQTGQYLHRFQWLDDAEIGNLDPEWNWLAGWYQEPQDGTPKAIHYTEGGPWFKEYRQCEYHEVWKQNLREMLQ
jgi:lipopolysaccharide biosynthesis glycosyltransferase